MNKTLLASLVLASALSLSASEFCDAAKANNTDTIMKLVADGQDINQHCYYGKTALHFAVSENNVPLVKRLLVSHADINAKDVKGNTPLHYAYYYSSTGDFSEMLRILKQAGADDSIKNSSGKTPKQMVKQK